MAEVPVEPFEVAQLVERYVSDAHRSAEKYSNSSPLDENGVFVLHRLAAQVYARVFQEGRAVEAVQNNEARIRARDYSTPDRPRTTDEKVTDHE